MWKLLASLAALMAALALAAAGLAAAAQQRQQGCTCVCPSPPLPRRPPLALTPPARQCPALLEPLRNPPPAAQSPPAAAAANTNAGLAPSTIVIGRRTHYYQVPKDPRGTLFVFPGCARTGVGFWPYDARACAQCAGLSEDVAHTKQALARGYAIVVFTAAGKSFCWGGATDGEFIKTAIPQFLAKRPELRGKPVYVMGASSGGGLMQRSLGDLGVRIDGCIALVATSTEVDQITRTFSRGEKPPPIVWITMAEAKEIATARALVAGYKRHAPAATVATKPHRITDTYFSDRHPLITPTQSAQMAAQMRKLRVIREDGSFTGDPKKNRAWLKQMTAALPFLRTKNFPVAPFEKGVVLQAVMVAVARHEHVCDYLTAALMWLERGGKTDFEPLARRYQVVRPAALTAARQAAGAEPTPAEAFAYGLQAQPQGRPGRGLLLAEDSAAAEPAAAAAAGDDGVTPFSFSSAEFTNSSSSV